MWPHGEEPQWAGPNARSSHAAGPESKQQTAHVWLSKAGRVPIDDKRVSVRSVRNVIYAKLTTSLKADRDTPMMIITEVQQEFRRAYALKVNYAAEPGAD